VSARPARGDELPDVTPSRLGIAPRFASAPGLDAATIPNVGTPARGDQPPLVTSVAIKAPWLGGLGFLAGGLDELVFLLGEVLLSPAIGFVESEIIFQLWRNSRDASNSECGWSPASGAYYNQLGHAYDPPNSYDQFAIDFSRWSGNGIAAENLSKGTPILACGNGVVLGLEDRYPSGSDRQNIVELGLAETFAEAQLHRTYNPRTDPPYARGIYRASHVHLEGPLLSPVSRLQWVEQGFVLGFMDDSGNSFHDHLHFHIQDRRLLAEGSGSGAGNGRTVRPYWMEGETLFDDEGGKCIVSTNTPANRKTLCLWLAELIHVQALADGATPFEARAARRRFVVAFCNPLPRDRRAFQPAPPGAEEDVETPPRDLPPPAFRGPPVEHATDTARRERGARARGGPVVRDPELPDRRGAVDARAKAEFEAGESPPEGADLQPPDRSPRGS